MSNKQNDIILEFMYEVAEEQRQLIDKLYGQSKRTNPREEISS